MNVEWVRGRRWVNLCVAGRELEDCYYFLGSRLYPDYECNVGAEGEYQAENEADARAWVLAMYLLDN